MRHSALVTAILIGSVICGTVYGFAADAVNVDLADNGITLSKPSLRAGEVSFVVKNDSVSETHEFVIVRIDETKDPLAYDSDRDRVVEKGLQSVGEVEEVAPGASETLTVNLDPGTYTMLCNIKGHYKDGMHGVFTVQ